MPSPESSTPQPQGQPKSLAVLVIAVAAVVVLAIIGGFYAIDGLNRYLGSLQPNIQMTDFHYSTTECSAYGPLMMVYTWEFNLTNTGTADGFATVAYYVNNTWAAQNQYYVPQQETIHRTQSVQGAVQDAWPCALEWPNLAVIAVTRA